MNISFYTRKKDFTIGKFSFHFGFNEHWKWINIDFFPEGKFRLCKKYTFNMDMVMGMVIVNQLFLGILIIEWTQKEQ